MEDYMSFNYEIINFDEGLPVKIIIHKVDRHRLHWHNELEILIVLSGQITVKLTNGTYILFEDDLFLFNRNEVHSIEADTDTENIVVIIQIDLEHFKNKSPLINKTVFECRTYIKTNNKELFDTVKYYIATIVYTLNKKPEGYKMYVESYVGLLLFCLVNNFVKETLDDENIKLKLYDLERIKRITNYVDENYNKRISLTDVANMEFLNPYYLSHFIKNKFGISFNQYLTTVRLKKAHIELLKKQK
jgi:xylan 1,4-beta-xylosidase